MSESYRYIRNTWLEGNGALCLGIPSEIVKKLKLNSNSLLLVELVDDSIIVMKKHDPQFTKVEINRVMSYQDNTSKKPITNEAKRKDTSVNVIASHKLEDYYSKRVLKEKNNMYMLKNVLKMMFDSNTPEKMDEYTDQASQFVLSEWKLQVKNPNLEEFHKRVTEWHDLNHIDVSMFEEDSQHRKYVIRHELGLRWSEFQCKLYSKMLQKIKQTVICTDFDELSFTIEIAKSG